MSLPLWIGVQWEPTTAPDICLSPGSPNAGGIGAYVFPQGGTLHALTMQIAAKATKFELLAGLVMTVGNVHTHLLMGYISSDDGRKEDCQSISLPEPMDIPAGAVIWAAAQGWGETASTPLDPELHATLWVGNDTVGEVYPES
jgi:hypothetical protein